LERCDLLRFFKPEEILGREEVRPKPDPEGIFKLLERWDAQPKEAVMVGDFRSDLEAGRQAGTATIWLDLPEVQSGDFRKWADLRVESLEELFCGLKPKR